MSHPAPVFRGTVEKGRLSLEYPGAFKALLARLEGKQISLRLTKHHHSRSLSQNRYLFGVVYPIFAEAVGYEVEELHEALKQKFLRNLEEEERLGLSRVRSTRDLTTKEFTDYIERIRQLAAENGVVIPDPGAAVESMDENGKD